MFSRRKARLIAFAAIAAALGGGLFVYVAPASTNVDPAPVVHQPGIASNATNYRSWGEGLFEDAIDAAGIETDLDGNASALLPSDCFIESPGCR